LAAAKAKEHLEGHTIFETGFLIFALCENTAKNRDAPCIHCEGIVVQASTPVLVPATSQVWLRKSKNGFNKGQCSRPFQASLSKEQELLVLQSVLTMHRNYCEHDWKKGAKKTTGESSHHASFILLKCPCAKLCPVTAS